MQNDEKNEREKEKGPTKKAWEDLIYKAIETIASAPNKLKDPRETVVAAVDWVKSVRDDAQQKIRADISEKISQIDWEAMSKKVAEHIVENFDIEVSARVSFKPRSESKKTGLHEDLASKSNESDEFDEEDED